MRSIDISLLVFRWLHILAAIVAMGGLAFAHFALLPALDAEDDGTRARIHEAIRRRWLPWVIGAITALLVSGLVNYLVFTGDAIEWEQGEWLKRTRYHALFGVKFLLAMVVFFFASGLVGRGAGTQWIRDARRKWSTVTLLVALGIVVLSGWMRQLHTGPARQAVSTADEGGMEAGGGGFGEAGGEGGTRFRGGPPGGFGDAAGSSFRRPEGGRPAADDAPADEAAPAGGTAPADRTPPAEPRADAAGEREPVAAPAP